MASFDVAFEVALGHEGGLSMDPEDSGNWTGGKKGVGVLKGTKFGISAASYPHLDIESLTVDQAKAIYLYEWWNKNHYGDIASQMVATKVFDLAINMGDNRAEIILQFAAWQMGAKILVDGVIGPKTIAAVNVLNAQELLDKMRQGAEKYYRDLVARKPEKAKFLDNWVKRARS